MACKRLVAALALAAILCPSAGWAWSPPKRAVEPKLQTCPEVGDGFVRLPGSDTCVRLGGLVRVEAAKVGNGR